jgi:hypothetical protein
MRCGAGSSPRRPVFWSALTTSPTETCSLPLEDLEVLLFLLFPSFISFYFFSFFYFFFLLLLLLLLFLLILFFMFIYSFSTNKLGRENELTAVIKNNNKKGTGNELTIINTEGFFFFF